MISISTSQTFRSWVVIFHLRQPMTFLSLNLYNTPGLAPRMNVFFLRARRLSSKLRKQGYLVEHLKSSFRKFNGRYGDLIQQYKVSLSRMLNDILILDQQWLPDQSDIPPISWPWDRLWPSPNYEWFPWSICNRCGMPAGNAYPSGHLVPSPILGLAYAPIVETKFLELAMSLLDFSPRMPLGTFSILPLNCRYCSLCWTFNLFSRFLASFCIILDFRRDYYFAYSTKIQLSIPNFQLNTNSTFYILHAQLKLNF